MTHVISSWKNRVIDDRYEVHSILGRGGMADVYLAYDRRLETKVVIKTPQPQLLQDPQLVIRFQHEVRSLVQLSHPGVVQILDVDEHEEKPFCVMQFLAGGSLEEREHDKSAGDLTWLTSVAETLDFIHEKDFLHRDVKPANILFDEHGHAFLSDFGIAKALAQSPAQALQQTGTGLILGTPAYIPPEVVMGKTADGRADQYALAVTVFEVLCGTRPFTASTPSAVLVLQTTRKPPSPRKFSPSLPRAMDAILARGLAKRPHERFKSCTEFAKAVTECFANPQAVPIVQPTLPVAQPTNAVSTTTAASPAPPKVRREPAGDSGTNNAGIPTRQTATAEVLERPNRKRWWYLAAAPLLLLLMIPLLLRNADRLSDASDSDANPSPLANSKPGSNLTPAPRPGSTPSPGPAAPRASLNVVLRTSEPQRPRIGDKLQAIFSVIDSNVGTVRFEYTRDGGRGWASADRGAVTIPNAPAGVIRIKVRATTSRGHRGETEHSWQVVRNRPPRIVSAELDPSATGGRIRKLPAAVILEGVDPERDAMTFEYRLHAQKDWQPVNGNRAMLRSMPPGKVKVEFRARDVRGDYSEVHSETYEFVPNRAPKLVLAPPQPGWPLPGGKLRLPYSVDDDEPGSTTVEYRRNGGDWRPAPASPLEIEKVEAGTMSFEFRVTDNSGLMSTASRSVEIKVPKSPGFAGLEVKQNSLNMSLIKLPAGEFVMGGVPGDGEVKADESPRHGVRITKPIWIGQTEVSLQQYFAVLRVLPRNMNRRGRDRGDFPAAMVTWRDAVRFCDVLSAMPLERKAGRVYRLPTEAEWEYACRAGTISRFNTGNTLNEKQAEYSKSNSSQHGPVNSYPKSPAGLFRIHGGVSEWCQDVYDPEFYWRSPIDDPVCLKKLNKRLNDEDVKRRLARMDAKERERFDRRMLASREFVYRGGSRGRPWQECRSSARDKTRNSGGSFIGFRVVCEVGPPRRVQPAVFFNGKDLKNWDYNKAYWKVEKGVIVARSPNKARIDTALLHKTRCRDFEISCEVKVISNTSHSLCGIKFRSEHADFNLFGSTGPLVCFRNDSWGRIVTGRDGLWTPANETEIIQRVKKNQYNAIRLRVLGRRCTLEINNKVELDNQLPKLPDKEGKVGFFFGTPRYAKVEYFIRNIKFKKLVGGKVGKLEGSGKSKNGKAGNVPVPAAPANGSVWKNFLGTWKIQSAAGEFVVTHDQHGLHVECRENGKMIGRYGNISASGNRLTARYFTRRGNGVVQWTITETGKATVKFRKTDTSLIHNLKIVRVKP